MREWPRIERKGLWALGPKAAGSSTEASCTLRQRTATSSPEVPEIHDEQMACRGAYGRGHELSAGALSLRAESSSIIRRKHPVRRTAFGETRSPKIPWVPPKSAGPCRANAVPGSTRAWLGIERGCLWAWGPKAAGSSTQAPCTSRQRTVFGEPGSREVSRVTPNSSRDPWCE